MISGVSVGDGFCDITFTTDFFNSAQTIVGTIDITASFNDPLFLVLNSSSLTTANFRITFNNTNVAPVNRWEVIHIVCGFTGADYTAARAMTTKLSDL